VELHKEDWKNYNAKIGTDGVEGQKHIPIEVAIIAAFLCYRYKFVSRATDRNLYRLPIRWISKQWTYVLKNSLSTVIHEDVNIVAGQLTR